MIVPLILTNGCDSIMHDQHFVVYISLRCHKNNRHKKMSSRSVAKAADVLERWYNLLEQESTAYKTTNYLITPGRTANDEGNAIDTDAELIVCRSKLVAWMYNLVDKYSLDRELVAVAASYMDRYLEKHTSSSRGHISNLVGMTSLYLAIKIYRDQGKCAGAVSFAGLSRGLFNELDIIKMESSILKSLDWRVHPPTVFVFARACLVMVPRDACSPFSRRCMFERIRYLLELSIAVPFFLGKKPSDVAVGAFIEIMESDEQPNVKYPNHQSQFKRRLYILTGIDSDSDKVTVCRNALKKIYKEAKVELEKKDVAAAAAAIVTP